MKKYIYIINKEAWGMQKKLHDDISSHFTFNIQSLLPEVSFSVSSSYQILLIFQDIGLTSSPQESILCPPPIISVHPS